MLIDFDYYFDKKINIKQLKKKLAYILGMPVSLVDEDNVPLGCAFLNERQDYPFAGFNLFWRTEKSSSTIANNFEMAKRMAVEFDTNVVTNYAGKNKFEYDWYMYDPQGNLFLVDMDDDTELYLYDTKRAATLPIAKTPAAA